MQKLGLAAVAVAALAISGCGGGGSSTPVVSPTVTPATPTPTPSPSPTPTPTAAPTAGPVVAAYTTAFGVSGTAPSTLGFLAPTQTASLTVTETNYTGAFTAASSCAAITVSPASSPTGAFTLTAAGAAASGCTITITGATGQTATLAATVATPAGVQLRWYLPNYAITSAPVPQSQSPINLVGTGPTFASILAISELNYVGGFAPAKVVASAGCTGFATIAAAATTPAGLPTAAPGASLVYYTVTGVAAVTTAGGCTITASDSYTPLTGPTNAPAAIGVSITTVGGTFQ